MKRQAQGPLALYCWKIAVDGRNHYVTFFGKDQMMYKYTTIDGCHFAEKRHYLVTYLHAKEKVFQTGRPYRALHGVFILSRISKQQFDSEDYELPERTAGETVQWLHNNDLMTGEITEIERDPEVDEWIYHVRARAPYVFTDMIGEEDIIKTVCIQDAV